MANVKPTWLAVIVCVIAVIVPGLFVGGAVAFVYRMGVSSGPVADPFMLNALFGIDAPRRLLDWILVQGLGETINGGIAGALAAGLTTWICRGANILRAICVTGALYTAVVVLTLALGIVVGITANDAVGSIFQLGGLWMGLGSVAATAPQSFSSS